MTSTIDELREAQEDLQAIADSIATKEISDPIGALEKSANSIGRSWGGSWFGYQSRVYYEDFKSPPAGAHFSSEWGLRHTYSMGTEGEWAEYEFETVEKEIFLQAGSPDLSRTREVSKAAKERLEERSAQILSVLETELAKRSDPFLQRLLDEAKKLKPMTASEYVAYLRPSGQLMSRDTLALTQGLQMPPHISVLADLCEIESPGVVAKDLAKLAKQAASHLERIARDQRRAERVGTNVFIGHGRSRLWKDLKDFVQDRLHLPWDEFNRVPVAGITNIARLSEMLDSAAVAFIIMTAEDEQADGKMHARMNVMHEAGLFQGRLGFTKAIVLLEDGCEEFSNIDGLGQIRFPKGNILAAFEEIRLVLEREGLIEAK